MNIIVKFPMDNLNDFRITADISLNSVNVGELTLFLNDSIFFSNLKLEMEYRILTDYQNKGIAKKAVRTVIEYLKQNNYDEINIRISKTPANVNYIYSKKIAEGLDFIIDSENIDEEYSVYVKILNENKLSREEKIIKLSEIKGKELAEIPLNI